MVEKWSTPARVRPKSRPPRHRLGPDLAKAGQILAKSDLNFGRLGPDPICPSRAQVLAKSGTTRGRHGLDSGPTWPRRAQVPDKSDTNPGRTSAWLVQESGPSPGKVGPTPRSTWSRLGPDLAKSSPSPGQVGPESRTTWPRLWPDLAKSGRSPG